ncbi:unnamed protein product [Clavelina lepadiformis]|uniref:RNA helicase n=1 Tax=Clavelina lepadiformis TaxID=159417 RepID=A0ABP0G3M5_CLALP
MTRSDYFRSDYLKIVRTKRKRVLVCAPSNSACDLLTERLLEHVDKKEIFRMHAMSRPVMDVPDVVLEVSNYDKFTEDYYYPSIQTIMDFYLVITTLITAGRLSSAEIPSNHFDYIFIDEAGQSVEPECIIPIESLLGGDGRLVLAGDPKQLGPILRSQAAIEYGLGKSLLERLMESDAYKPNESVYPEQRITKLLSNYRSHEAILKTSNECFYDNELKVEADVFLREQFYNWEHLPKRGFPVIFHGVIGEDQREENSPSYFNPQEASEVYNYVKKILESRQNPVKPKQIGIISPYRKQVQKIRQVLNREKLPISRKIKARNMRRVPEDMEDNSDFKEIKVGSVEEFQGQERRVIIISTVRSNCRHLPHDEKFQLGFLRNPKRFNVAMTRAMSLLIVIGNPEILCKDEHWNKLLTYCIEKGGYTGANFTPDHQDDITMRMNSLGLNEEFLDDNTTEDVSKLQGEVDPPWRDDI